jgi:hypothetical protein
MIGSSLALGHSPSRAAALLVRPDTFASQINFTRGSAASVRDAAGVLQQAATNVPRADYRWTGSAWTAAGVLIEGARTNRLLRSGDQSVSPWTTSGGLSVTGGAGVAPDGSNGATLLNDTDSATVGARDQSVAITSGSGSYTASAYMKAGTSSVASLRFILVGGTVVSGEGVVNLATGAVQPRDATPLAICTCVGVGNGWYRVSVTISDNGSGNNSALVTLRPAFAPTYSPALSAATGSALMWGVQLESGATATSYIATAAATATRSADVASRALAGEFGSVGQSALLKLRWPVTASSGRIWQWDDGTESNRVTLQAGGGVIQAVMVAAGSVVATVNGPAVTAGGDYRIGFGFGTGVLRLAVNGTVSGDAAPAVLPTALAQRRIGGDSAGGSQPDAWIMPYLTHPAGLMPDASEWRGLLSAPELQSYTG